MQKICRKKSKLDYYTDPILLFLPQTHTDRYLKTEYGIYAENMPQKIKIGLL